MTTQLNTLFVTTEGSLLRKAGDAIRVTLGGRELAKVPIHHLASVVCFGRVTATPPLLLALSEAGTSCAFFSEHGRFQARVEGLPGGSILLRQAQFRAADAEAVCLEIARCMVLGKVTTTRTHLLRGARDATETPARDALADGAKRIGELGRRIEQAATLDALRGVEGMAARLYFEAFNALLKVPGDEFAIAGRSRRPPKDRTNALLSFGYALLQQDCSAALAGVGLDPALGFLHSVRSGRLALALDLMEEFRVPFVDRLILRLINRRQINADDVEPQDDGSFRLTDKGRKTLLVEYQKMKQEEIQHPFLEQKVPWQRVPHFQALLLARTLRGDLSRYPPFFMK